LHVKPDWVPQVPGIGTWDDHAHSASTEIATLFPMHRLIVFAALLLVFGAPANAQWQLQTSNTTADLRGIHSLGNGVAWASGANGTVLRTEDGGYVWQTCAMPPGAEKLDFRGIQGFDANRAIVMSSGKGDLSRLYKTTDGCSSWKLVLSNDTAEGFWDAVVFQHGDFGFAIGDSQTGVLIGDPVDGRFQTYAMILGHGWFIDDSGCNALEGQSAFAASNSSIFVFGSRRYVLGTGGKPGPAVYLSPLLTGGAASGPCKRIPVPLAAGNDSSGIFSVGFRDLKHGVAAGGDYLKPDVATGTAAWTSDLGRDWSAAINPPHGYRSSVAYDAATKNWITVGPNGTDVSADDGKNWRPLRPDPARHEAPDADRNWNAISLPFVVGPHGRIGRLNPESVKR
jgi:photosystem II stability/assembly factor-like uncharacterized protein